MVAPIYSGEEGRYFWEEVDYHGGSGQLPTSKEGEPCNEGWMGSWVNQGGYVAGGSLGYFEDHLLMGQLRSLENSGKAHWLKVEG